VSKYEAELRRRLERGDDLTQIGLWYLGCLTESNIEWMELSPLELKFMRQIRDAYAGPGPGDKIN
jgi:hypothetical protein